ncbi:hypothetical protein B0H16DRAFT_1697727 [Mycena metata]|uniref:NADP-dependent oxidoreductase domain-containing protein n=1 Tax=Mycena metata TaxID=1033252 RepID=A0AAD7HUC1_9AGAR|nr:hypothetical protein B0H16DRAFT_1697727 [Mycena metata]
MEAALDNDSLTKLGTDYLDVYLMHRSEKRRAIRQGACRKPIPDVTKVGKDGCKRQSAKYRCQGAERILHSFSVRRLENLIVNPLKIRPAVIQIEINYCFPQPDLFEWPKERNISVEVYSPLGGTSRVEDTFDVPEIK